MSILSIQTPRAFVPLLKAARYKGAWGGRGSGKSHFFAELMIEEAATTPNYRAVCLREVQKDLKESAKLLLEDKIAKLGVSEVFDCQRDQIKTTLGGLIIFRGMQDYNSESIKSLEGFKRAWIEEAQTLSQRSLELLRPTIRAAGSQIWASWNPRNASDPIDQFLRGQTPPPDSIVVKANYSDNPFLPRELEQERAHDAKTNPLRYAHIWLGEYEPAAIGAIWDRKTLHENRRDKAPEMARIVVAVDPAVSSEASADEHGIIVAGVGGDKRGYVLDDVSTRGTPHQWASRAIAAYDRYGADAIVVEVNQGGEMCKATLQSVRAHVPIIEVRATRGKHVRAEPISALYTLGRVSHVGTFPELENQMCLMTAGGYEGEGSPDRCDALVWAFTELFPDVTTPVHKPATDEVFHGEGGWMS
ncbi:MAG: PBSX family phage terminase large subunit [Azospirillum sp.]|nr:PBSX family phage terminase large subunit [Azospirillum sp.]